MLGRDLAAERGHEATATALVDNTEAAAQRIESTLTLGPVLQPSLGQVMMKDVRVELTMDDPIEEGDFNSPIQRLSGPFLSILSGQTAEEAIGENITSVLVAVDPDFPSVTVDGGSPPSFTPTYTYDFGAQPVGGGSNPTYANSLDLFYEPEIAGTYETADTLITDPTSRTYSKGKMQVYNVGSPSTDWYIRHFSASANEMYQRDETLPGTSADTPGGTYEYASDGVTISLLPLPTGITAPRYTISSATYDNTNQNQLGTLLPGRNDAFRCRIRDQAAYVQIESLGVPWAIERMAVLIEPYGHTKNVKGTY